jgi:polar amino acid transport system substrate-binding protein
VKKPFATTVLAGLLTATALAAAGCASNGPAKAGGGPSGGSSSSSSTASTGSSSASTSGGVDAAAAALLPAAIKKSGKLTIGVDPTYPPNEYRDSSGNITGWDVELFAAVAKRLGLTAAPQQATFDTILPSVTRGRYDVGVSSFTDNAEREKQVDFVTYFSAGYQWAARKGSNVTAANPCGLTVAAGVGTDEALHDVPDLSKQCVKDGKKPIKLLTYQTQDLTTESVVLGKADAMDADSPVTGYAVQKTGGKLQLAGKVYEAAPYGVLMAKNAGTLKQALQKAIQSMIADGTYQQILTKWGVQAGAIKTAQINAANAG